MLFSDTIRYYLGTTTSYFCNPLLEAPKLLYLLVPTRANFVFMMFAPLAVTFVSPAINMCTVDSTEGGALRVDEELRVASSMAADCKVCTHPHHFSFHHSSKFLLFRICYGINAKFSLASTPLVFLVAETRSVRVFSSLRILSGRQTAGTRRSL